MQTCLVTGGAGFIGSHVANELIKLGYKAVVLDDLSGGFEDNLPKDAEFVKGSITDNELILELFDKHKFDYVFHLAAYAAENLSSFIKRYNYNNNLIGSMNLINASVNHQVKCFVFTSSIAVYGENQLPMHEDLTPNPEDPYGIAKFAVELDLKTTKHMFGMDYIIFRPHNVYGEHQNIGDKYRNVLGIFTNQLMQGLPLTIFGDGKQTRAFSYIGDVAPIIAKSIENKHAYNQIINVGADEFYTVNEIAQKILDAFGQEGEIKHLKERKEVKHAYCSHEKLTKLFDYKTQFTIDQGIKNMVDWCKKVGARKSREFSNIEIRKNLPQGWE